MPIKYQENTKKVGTEIPNTDLVFVFSWYLYQIFGYPLTSLYRAYRLPYAPFNFSFHLGISFI